MKSKTKLVRLPLGGNLKGDYFANPDYVTQIEPRFDRDGGNATLIPNECKIHVLAHTGFLGDNVTTWIIGMSPAMTATYLNQ